jgi:glycerol dehydrogenase
VEHDEEGRVLDLLDLDEPPPLCVADFEILGTSPRRLLNAGLVDTLAKWLEWQALELPEGPGAEAARMSGETVRDLGAPLSSLWNACLRLSSEASNEGHAPAAAAHSFCAGISILARSRAWLHGEWVGLGLLFQAELLGEPREKLGAYLASLGLPIRIPFKLSDKESAEVIERILAPQESIHLLKGRAELSHAALAGAFAAISD